MQSDQRHRTIFVARYIRSRELQRVTPKDSTSSRRLTARTPSSTTAKRGEIASNRQDEQEMTVPRLRIDLRAALVYVNTLMFQDVLAEDD